jgi:hypothetical protein
MASSGTPGELNIGWKSLILPLPTWSVEEELSDTGEIRGPGGEFSTGK